MGLQVTSQCRISQGSVLRAEGLSCMYSSLTESWRQHDFFWVQETPFHPKPEASDPHHVWLHHGWKRLAPCTVFETPPSGFCTRWLAAAYTCQSTSCLIFIVSCSKDLKAVAGKIKHPYIEKGMEVYWEAAKLSECLIAYFVFMCHFQEEGGKRGEKHHGSVIKLINIGKG